MSDKRTEAFKARTERLLIQIDKFQKEVKVGDANIKWGNALLTIAELLVKLAATILLKK